MVLLVEWRLRRSDVFFGNGAKSGAIVILLAMNQPISAARFVDLLPVPPTVSLAWSAFSLTVSEPPLHVTAAFTDHLLASQISGRCRLRQEVAGRSVERWSGPGAVSLAPAHVKGTWDATGPSRVIHLLWLAKTRLSENS
jgi:hypothetical protein